MCRSGIFLPTKPDVYCGRYTEGIAFARHETPRVYRILGSVFVSWSSAILREFHIYTVRNGSLANSD